MISAVNLLVENCLFANTWGTAPEAGIDLEPDTEKQRLVNCVIRNSTFENNNGNEILVYLEAAHYQFRARLHPLRALLGADDRGAPQAARTGTCHGPPRGCRYCRGRGEGQWPPGVDRVH